MGATVEKVALAFAPGAVIAYRRFAVIQTVTRAVTDGVCVFLLACMLLASV